MKKLDDLIENLKSFERDLINIIKDVVSENKELISDMIAEDQLFEQGINGAGVKISDYAPYSPLTIQIKQEKGQPTARVTLRDEGDFHRSIDVLIREKEFEIVARDEKTDILIRKYGRQILWLTDDNFNELADNYVAPEILEKMKEL